MAQVVKHLPGKCRALSSNPSPTKRKEKAEQVKEKIIALKNKPSTSPIAPTCIGWSHLCKLHMYTYL
jgi:hypothetical protein